MITHEKGLANCADDALAFVDAMSGLDQKLGPLLLQMPPSWGAGALDTLTSFLPSLPSGFRYALEVRHRSWLAKDTLPKLLGLLQKHAVALCLVQHAWMPALDEVTAPFVYIRWLGRREDIPDDDFSHVRINRDAQLDSWSEQIKGYLQGRPDRLRLLQQPLPGALAGVGARDADAADGSIESVASLKPSCAMTHLALSSRPRKYF